MFYNRITELSTARSVKITPVLEELGMSRGNLTKWKNGVKPTADALIKLADYFDVSIDYLLCRTDDPSPIPLISKRLTDDPAPTSKPLEADDLTPGERAKVAEYKKFLIQQRDSK